MFKYNKITIFLLLSNLLLLLNACNPNSSQITIYTTDIDEVKKGEIVDVPMKLSFQMIGEDEDNSLEKSKNIAIKFLHPDSKFYITKGQYTKDFVVETFIPMLIADDNKINDYFKNNIRLFALYYYPKFTNAGSDKVELVFQKPSADGLNRKLLRINPLLQLKSPPTEMKFRIISDSKKEKKIGAYSVWVSKKPFLSKLANLKRREEVEFVFKGGADSIYSNIPAHIYIINK